LIRLEEWVDIVALHKQGLSIKAIARKTGLPRNTVRAVLRRDGPPERAPQIRPPSKFEPYKDYLVSRLTDCRSETFLSCYVNAFAAFGGRPKEILYDNAKAVALEHSRTVVTFNAALLDFAGR